jgi:ATP-grasp domain, R2K clade family 3
MIKVNWIVEAGILEHDTFVGDLPKAIIDSGAHVHLSRYVPFSDDQDYGGLGSEQCVVLYGNHNYVSKCKVGFVPGAYGLTQNTSVQHYYTQIPLNWLLNGDKFTILPFGVIKQDHQRAYDFVHSTKFFMRPLSGFKTFPGQVFKEETIDFEFNSTQKLSSVMEDTLCMIAPVKKLIAEYRFIIVNNEVVGGSQYRRDDKLDVRRDYSNDALRMAKRMAMHSWQPDLVYTCDVADTEDGPYIIEINSFSCAGLYACDLSNVVKRVNEVAIMEHKGEL